MFAAMLGPRLRLHEVELIYEIQLGATVGQLFDKYWPRVCVFDWLTDDTSLKMLLSMAKQIAEDGDPLD